MVTKKELDDLRKEIDALQSSKSDITDYDDESFVAKLDDLRFKYRKMFKQYELNAKNCKLGDFK